MIFATWCAGAVINKQADFENYVKATALENLNPDEPVCISFEVKRK